MHEQNEFAGAPTHLRVDITGSAAYFILQQAAYVNVHSKTSTYEAELLASEADMQRILGLPQGITFWRLMTIVRRNSVRQDPSFDSTYPPVWLLHSWLRLATT